MDKVYQRNSIQYINLTGKKHNLNIFLLLNL